MIRVLQDGKSWIAVDKPAGLPTQAPSQHKSLESVLRKQLADRASYLAMPHRLDVPVSGVVLVALTKKAARLLSQQFEARKISKRYHAIVAGDASQIETQWEDWICKIPDQAKVERGDGDQPGARSATTVVEQADFDEATGRTRLVLRPITGRMHQLRIGASSRGFPIMGDEMYSGGLENTAEEIQLRSVSIAFHDPVTGKRIQVDADPLSWP